MRWLVFTVLALSGCDWDAAERKARCARGELESCVGGFDDAGVDGGLEANPHLAIATDRQLVGLFPRSDAGDALLVVRNEARVIGVDGQQTGQTISFAGPVIDAYADGVSLPWLAVIAEVGGARQVEVVALESGSQRAFPTAASWVTVFPFTNLTPAISTWANDGGVYTQVVYDAPTLMPFSPQTGSCRHSFYDQEVLRLTEGARVVQAYVAEPGCSIMGLGADAGITSIDRSGARDFVVEGDWLRVGRNSITLGFRAAQVEPGETVVSTADFVWNGMGYVQGATVRFTCDAGLTLGDVSGDVVSGIAYGPVEGVSAGFPPGSPTAFVASASSTRWVTPLGPTLTGSHVAVLRLGARVLVAWLSPDRSVNVRQLDALDGR